MTDLIFMDQTGIIIGLTFMAQNGTIIIIMFLVGLKYFSILILLPSQIGAIITLCLFMAMTNIILVWRTIGLEGTLEGRSTITTVVVAIIGVILPNANPPSHSMMAILSTKPINVPKRKRSLGN